MPLKPLDLSRLNVPGKSLAQLNLPVSFGVSPDGVQSFGDAPVQEPPDLTGVAGTVSGPEVSPPVTDPRPQPANARTPLGALQQGIEPLRDITSAVEENVNAPIRRLGIAGLEFLESAKMAINSNPPTKMAKVTNAFAVGNNAIVSIPEMMLGLLTLPFNAAKDPVGTAEAIVMYAPEQFKLLLEADLLGMGRIDGQDMSPEDIQKRDAARQQLGQDPLGPLFAMQLLKGGIKSGTKAAKAAGRGLKDIFRSANQVALENTADLLLGDLAPSTTMEIKVGGKTIFKKDKGLVAPKGERMGAVATDLVEMEKQLREKQKFEGSMRGKPKSEALDLGEGAPPSAEAAALEQGRVQFTTTDMLEQLLLQKRYGKKPIFEQESPVVGRPDGRALTTMKEAGEVVLEQNKSVAQAPPESILNTPVEPYYERILSSLPRNRVAKEAFETAFERFQRMRLRKYQHGEVVREGRKQFSRAEQNAMKYEVQKTRDAKTGRDPELSQEAIDYAQNIIKPRMDFIFEQFSDMGLLTEESFIQDYLGQYWDLGKKKGTKSGRVGKLRTSAPKGRTVPSYFEGETKLGMKPKYENIFDIWTVTEELYSRVSANNEMVKSMWNLVDDAGNPMIAPSSKKFAHLEKEGYIRSDNPVLKRAMFNSVHGKGGGKPRPGSFDDVLIHPHNEWAVNQIFSDPWFGRDGGLRSMKNTYDFVNASMKAANLTLSLFHPFALIESSMGLGTRGPFRMGEGLRLLDEVGKVEEYIGAGLELGSSVDVGRSIVRNALVKMEQKAAGKPIVGPAATFLRGFKDVWDETLWDKMHRGYKVIAYEHFKMGMLKRHPEVDLKTIQRQAAIMANDAFGGQNWDAMIISPGFQEGLHAFLLSPDWGISVARQFGRGLESKMTGRMRAKAAGLNPELTKQMETISQLRGESGRRYWANYLMNNYLLLNMMNVTFTSMYDGEDPSTGKPMQAHFTWDNPPGHKFDFGPIPGSGDGEQLMYGRPSKQVREILRWPFDFVVQMGSKGAPLFRAIGEQFYGSSAGSGWDMPWMRPDPKTGLVPTFLESLPERFKQVGRSMSPFSFGDNQFAFTLPAVSGTSKFKFRRAYTIAFMNGDRGQMRRLERQASANDVNWAPIAISIQKRLGE